MISDSQTFQEARYMQCVVMYIKKTVSSVKTGRNLVLNS